MTGSESKEPGATLGLALSGGAVLGAAHIGVLKALDDLELRVTHLAGTSMGALVGTLYAFGLPGSRIEGIADAVLLRRSRHQLHQPLRPLG